MFRNHHGQIRSGWKILFVYLLFRLLSAPLLKAAFLFCFTHRGLLEFVPGFETSGSQFYEYLIGTQLLIQNAVLIAVTVYTWKFLDRKEPHQLGLTPIKEGKRELLTGILFGFLSISFVFAVILMTGSGYVDSKGIRISANLFFYIVVFGAVAIGEELFVRGYVMSVMKSFGRPYLSMVCSGIIFSLMHSVNSGINPLAYFNIFLIGVLFSYMYYKSGNLWLCIGYHAAWNYSQGNLYGFRVSGLYFNGFLTTRIPSSDFFNGGNFGPEGGILSTLVILLGFAVTWFLYRKKNQKMPVSG